MNTKPNGTDSASISFARLPVFDSQKNLWGYELVCVSAQGDLKSGSCDNMALDLASSTYMVLQQILDKGKKIMVNFSQKNILDNLPYALPPNRAAVKIKDPKKISDPALKLLRQLKDDGYQIATGWIKEPKTCQKIYHLSDIICLDISGLVLPDLKKVFLEAGSYNSTILAGKVDNQMQFNICAQTGISLLQGSFFKQPEDICVKKILSGTVSKFQLMKAIEQDEPDFEKLSKTIQADVAISFRLFSYLNSASFGFRQKITSIKDAITMLGWRNLKNWLRIVLLSQISENPHTPELVFLSAQRGKFLEQVCLDHDYWGFEPDSLSLLGMFSLLDAMLNQPMTEIVKYLPLPDKLKAALCIEENNEYVPLLKLAQDFEEARFEECEARINKLGLDSAKTRQAYQTAIQWADKLNEMDS